MGAKDNLAGTLPTLYIPHGGGPCFFMDWTMGPADTWKPMATCLASVGKRFSEPKALLVVSAHWEERIVSVQGGEQPSLYFDYSGFPPETYELTWPAPGAPALARRVQKLLSNAGIPNTNSQDRGFDHGTFVPLKVAYPDAKIPTLQVSLNSNLDAATHIALGRALAPLRDEGVLIIGSGMSFHNMRAMMQPGPQSLDASMQFDDWLKKACAGAPAGREASLERWSDAPQGRYSHPREEHLLPLMVAAGAAAGEQGTQIFRDEVMGVVVSAYAFGDSDASRAM